MSTERRYEHFINGQWVAPSNGDYFDSTNPATLDVLYRAGPDFIVLSSSVRGLNP